MAHFARINENNEVVEVVVVDNKILNDVNGVENEAQGVTFLKKLTDGDWVQTSYNASFRKNYAGIGFKYDKKLDAFVPPKPYESWLLDEATATWHSPVAYPKDGGGYVWDEKTGSWRT